MPTRQQQQQHIMWTIECRVNITICTSNRTEYRNHGTSVFVNVNTRLKRSHTNKTCSRETRMKFNEKKKKRITQFEYSTHTQWINAIFWYSNKKCPMTTSKERIVCCAVVCRRPKEATTTTKIYAQQQRRSNQNCTKISNKNSVSIGYLHRKADHNRVNRQEYKLWALARWSCREQEKKAKQ